MKAAARRMAALREEPVWGPDPRGSKAHKNI